MQGSILFLILVLCVLPFDCFSQGKEGNNWYFGKYAGISFNTPDGEPQALMNSAMIAHEGCAAISSSDGNLLFYTDGSTIFNAVHDTMQNGTELGGNNTSSQSGIIVPMPEHENIYYVFSVGPGIDDIYYSIVDMSLEGGLGAVINPKKNLLLQPSTERLTSVQHANGKDFWIVTHTYQTDEYYSYLLDSDSLHISNPVISSTGIVHKGMVIGCLKISPSGEKIATGFYNYAIPPPYPYELVTFIELSNFNTTSGVVSDPIIIGNFKRAYGIEFSQDDKLLYVTQWFSRYVRQYDISSWDSAQIAANIHYFGDSSQTYNGALQMGPDGRIYVARNATHYLDRINNPSVSGSGCNYESEAVYLGGAGTPNHFCILGLPNFIQSFFAPAAFSWENHCLGDTTSFSCDTASYDSVYWSFGDPGSGNNDSSSLFDPFHIYADTGYYPIQLISFYENFTDTLQDTIRIHPLPQPQLPDLLSVCPGDTATLWPGHFESYLWYDARTDTAIKVDTAGLYSVMVTDSNQCSATDTTHFGIFPKPDPLVIFHD